MSNDNQPVLPSSNEKMTQNIVLDALNLDDVDDDSGETSEEETPKLKDLEDDSDDSEDDKDSDDSEESEELEEQEIKIDTKDEIDEDLKYTDIPTRDAIKKAFPEIFKKFPGLDRAIYREKAYTDIFPSIKEAKSAQERIGNYEQLEEELFSGNVENVFSSIKQNDPAAFQKMSGKLLQTLHKVDQNSYFNIVNHIVKHALKTAFDYGEQNDNKQDGNEGEQMKIAAQLLHKFIYKTAKIEAPEVLPVDEKKTVNPEEEKFNKERNEFETAKFTAATSDVGGRIKSAVEKTIDKYIDPKQSMSSYVRDKAKADIMNELDSQMGKDPRFRSLMNNLWAQSKGNNYSEASKKQLVENALTKAQTLLGGIIRDVRNKALKDTRGKVVRKKVDSSEDDDRQTTRRTAAPNTKSSNSGQNNRPNARTVSGVMDFLGKD